MEKTIAHSSIDTTATLNEFKFYNIEYKSGKKVQNTPTNSIKWRNVKFSTCQTTLVS